MTKKEAAPTRCGMESNMGTFMKTYALMHGGRIYTLLPCKHMPGFKWIGFCDGQRCGFFKTKRDFERVVEDEADTMGPLGPHASATFEAETWSNYDGNKILKAISEKAKEQEGRHLPPANPYLPRGF